MSSCGSKLQSKKCHKSKPVAVSQEQERIDTYHPRSLRSHGVMFGELAKMAIDPRLDPPAFSCLNCWKHGHGWKVCPLPRSASFCANCGRRGVVDLSDCPRCGRPHREFLEARGAAEPAEVDVAELSLVVWDGDHEERSLTQEKVGDLARDIARLMDSMADLSSETKDLVVRQIVMERKEMLDRTPSYQA